MGRAKALAALCAVGLLGLACGSDEASAPEGLAEDASGAQASGDNRPPVIDEVRLEPSSPRPGQTVKAKVVASDPDGDSLRFDYSWRVGGMELDDKTSSLHVESLQRGGSIQVTVVARDAHGESAPTTAYARVGNAPPTIVQINMKPLGEVTAGNDVTASPVGTDLEGDEIEYRYRWTLNGETMQEDGATLPAKLLKRGDRLVLEVWASDGNDDGEPVKSAPIEVVNAAPKIVSTPGAIGADGVFRYDVKAEDPDGDNSLRYRLVKGPEGMTVGFDDGKVVWTPKSEGAAGTHDVEISVEDRFGGASSQRFALQLAFVTDALPAAPAPDAAPETPSGT